MLLGSFRPDVEMQSIVPLGLPISASQSGHPATLIADRCIAGAGSTVVTIGPHAN